MKNCLPTLLAAAVSLGATGAAHSSSTLVVNRGLPDSNLNNAAGSNRSNVAWAAPSFLVGDDFTLGSTGDANKPNWSIDKLSVWAIGDEDFLGDRFNNVSLFLGEDEGDIPKVLEANLSAGSNATDNADVLISQVTYPGTTTSYQGSGGGYLNIWQIDFKNVGAFAPGELLFALGAVPETNNVSMHASNADLSGTQQDDFDNLFRIFDGDGTNTSIAFNTMFDSDQPNVWDKSSDINVQVFATAVPSPSAALGGVIMLGGLVMRRRRRAA